jgi:NADP-dependent 3-hydroxy acid dehydrogenase YdfG
VTRELLQDSVAVVTGASSGIGAAVTRALAREGARVALAARAGTTPSTKCNRLSCTNDVSGSITSQPALEGV